MITFREVKDRATGCWDRILPALAPDLEEAVRKAPRHVRCPVHGGERDFRLDKDFAQRGSGICTCGNFSDGFELLAWVKNYTAKDALHEVAHYLGIQETTGPRDYRPAAAPKPAAPKSPPVANPYVKKMLREAWEGSLAADHPSAAPLRLYLEKRGIAISPIPAVLRFHPALPYFVYTDDGRSKCIGRPPAMLALVSDANGRPVTLHRTYLDTDGNKSPVLDVKKLMPSAVDGAALGGAIRLFPAAKLLGVAEGIETAIAVHLATGMPVWSCVNTSLMKRLIVPPVVEHLVIWADHDKINPKTSKRPGEDAATVLTERMHAVGRTTEILTPPGTVGPGDEGIDWLDIFVRFGSTAFGRYARVDVAPDAAGQTPQKDCA